MTAPPSADASTFLPDAWHITVTVPARAGPAMEAALDPDGMAVSVLELDDGRTQRVEAWADCAPDRTELEVRVAVAAAAMGIAVPTIAIDRVDGQDWFEASRRAFPPLGIGRFWVHGSHVAAPPGRIPLCIDANLAFGTGDHPTTAGCLLALEALAKGRRAARVLDMGTGTAILAMAAARLWPGVRCLGIDIDPVSVRVARANLHANHLHTRVQVAAGNGFATPAVRRSAPYDVITANILAQPLRAMAVDLVRGLAPAGVAILSGLMVHQEAGVLAAYRHAGLSLRHRRRIGVWSTLTLARG